VISALGTDTQKRHALTLASATAIGESTGGAPQAKEEW
jgi:hypothetical protein